MEKKRKIINGVYVNFWSLTQKGYIRWCPLCLVFGIALFSVPNVDGGGPKMASNKVAEYARKMREKKMVEVGNAICLPDTERPGSEISCVLFLLGLFSSVVIVF